MVDEVLKLSLVGAKAKASPTKSERQQTCLFTLSRTLDSGGSSALAAATSDNGRKLSNNYFLILKMLAARVCIFYAVNLLASRWQMLSPCSMHQPASAHLHEPSPNTVCKRHADDANFCEIKFFNLFCLFSEVIFVCYVPINCLCNPIHTTTCRRN